MSALRLIQTALYGKLHGDATLGALLAPSRRDGGFGVFNDVPDEQPYPYVQIGSGRELPWHTMGTATDGIGWNDSVTVHIWSRYQGDVEALAILTRVVGLLNFASIPVTGFATQFISLEEARVLVEQVEKVETRHVSAVFRMQVHQ